MITMIEVNISEKTGQPYGKTMELGGE
jgi:hypothetical protein